MAARPFSHIMACCDFSPGSAKAVEAAARQARLDGARLSLIHVVAPAAPILPEMDAGSCRGLGNHEISQLCRQYMERQYLPMVQGLEAKIILRRGHPVLEIIEQMAHDPVDLLVVGSQGLSGMGLVLFGSVAERLARRSGCTTLVAR